jgi:hypothetical protein
MAPSSYAEQYIEYLTRQGKYVSWEGTEAVKPEPEVPVPSRSAVRRENRRERELMTAAPQLPQKLVTTPMLIRSAAILIIIGALLIASVWMGAKATAIKYSMNSLNKENVQLRDEITVLGIDIEGAVSFESVATYATGSLGMVYPSKSQCYVIDESQTVDENLVKTIREKAYGN